MTSSPTLASLPATSRSGGRRRFRFALLAVAVLAAALLLLAQGITVVPDGEVASTDLAGNPTFVAERFVGSLWDSRVLPMMRDRAVAIGTVLDALAQNADQAGVRYGHRPKSGDGPWNFIVRGEGVITAADMRSRHATLTVAVGGRDVVVQVGPVIFGTTLRDSLPFISFEQVVNQIQFAQVSRELNLRASAAARDGLDPAALVPGAHVAFAGALSATQPPQVTAVQLHLIGGGQ